MKALGFAALAVVLAFGLPQARAADEHHEHHDNPAHVHDGHPHHEHPRVFFIGPSVVYLPAYSPYYYYPPGIILAPPTYLDGSSVPPGVQPAYWYYCDNPRGYYPNVRECPGGWRQVVPTPPP